jgi:hypothetical protein
MSSLGLYDVMCGRSKDAFNNVGNRRFRVTVALFLPRYVDASSRKEKTQIIQEIVDLVHSIGGRFVEWDSQVKKWIELDMQGCCRKVGHALRDMALSKNRQRATTKTPKKKASSIVSISSDVKLENDGVIPVQSSSDVVNEVCRRVSLTSDEMTNYYDDDFLSFAEIEDVEPSCIMDFAMTCELIERVVPAEVSDSSVDEASVSSLSLPMMSSWLNV